MGRGGLSLGLPGCIGNQGSGTDDQSGLVLWYCPGRPFQAKKPTTTGKDSVKLGRPIGMRKPGFRERQRPDPTWFRPRNGALYSSWIINDCIYKVPPARVSGNAWQCGQGWYTSWDAVFVWGTLGSGRGNKTVPPGYSPFTAGNVFLH